LSDQAKADFDQAGKCIALDVSTAAAFHMLRATEASIRKYYELIVPGDKRANQKMRNWGSYIRLIKNHDGNGSIIQLLAHIKEFIAILCSTQKRTIRMNWLKYYLGFASAPWY
jgi:hypothetical protein